jgi:hypothetical protein
MRRSGTDHNSDREFVLLSEQIGCISLELFDPILANLGTFLEPSKGEKSWRGVSGPSSAATPQPMAAVSLAFWKHVKSGRSRHAKGPHSRLPAPIAASCTMLIYRS